MREDSFKPTEVLDDSATRKNSEQGLVIADLVFLVWKYKKSIASGTLSVMVIIALLSLLLPKWYESSAVIILPEKSVATLDALAGNLGAVGSGLLGLTPSTSSNQRYLAILNSRRLREALIERYNLVSIFEVDYVEDALEILESTLTAEADKKNGTIVVTMKFVRDPVQTADMANFVIQKLDEINRELSTEQARFSRSFIEGSLNKAKEELRKAEDSLNHFQKRHGIIAITEQTKAAIEAAAQLQAEITTVEVEYNVKKRTLGINHPDIKRLESELAELQKNQNRFEYGGLNLSAFIPFKQTADVGLAYIRLLREVQINTKIVEFLVPQYEQAKIQEAKDTPTLLILDAARPAEYPFKPRKKVITLVAGVVAFCFLFGWVYAADTIRRKMSENDSSDRWVNLLNTIPQLKRIFLFVKK
jgi:uncharacterized protein involved in exopolysaccharide biosynthesis